MIINIFILMWATAATVYAGHLYMSRHYERQAYENIAARQAKMVWFQARPQKDFNDDFMSDRDEFDKIIKEYGDYIWKQTHSNDNNSKGRFGEIWNRINKKE